MPAAVDADGFAGDEVGLEQEHDRLRDLRLAAPSAERRGCLDRLQLLVARVLGRQDRAGRDGVDEDLVAGELERQRLGQADDARLAT